MSTHLSYNEDSIQVLEGLEAVRKRPGMYIGSTDSRGLHHLVYEIVDNAIDEVLAGYGNQIKVTIHENNSISVQDYGRGIPTGMHKSGKPTPEVIFTVLHAGGKFGTGGYKTSGGLHGVGASVVNALSEWVEVVIKRDGLIYRQRFEQGGHPVTGLEVVGKTKETGTLVSFKPDPGIFSTTVYSFDILSERLRESAFLLKGLKIELVDLRNDKEEVFYFEDGIKSFVGFLNEGKDALHEVVYFEGESQDIEVDFAFQYSGSYSENILSFVNNVRTKDGGTHETGAKAVLTRIFNDYARRNGLLKEKDKNLEGADIREGLAAIVSVRIPERLLQFEGQTKAKLGTPEARSAVDNVIAEKLTFYFNENGAVATHLFKKQLKRLKFEKQLVKHVKMLELEKKKRKKKPIYLEN